MLDRYNGMVSARDQLQNELEDQEAILRDKNKRMLAATAAHHGPNSSEYEQTGGTRESERRRATKKSPGKA